MAAIVVTNWSEFIAAIGTAGAEVEFPHTSTYLIKTQDTDVDANKLYLDSNGVVQTNVQPTDLENLYENIFQLDANDYAPEGLTTTISVSCASINGYGGSIRNLASDAADVLAVPSGISLTGIAFLNVSCKNHSFITAEWSGSYGTVQKCLFSGRFESNDYNDCMIKSPQIEYISCGFTAQLYGSAKFAYYDSYYGYPTFWYCRISTDDRRAVSVEDVEVIDINNTVWLGNYSHSITDAMSAIDYTVFDVACPAIAGNNNNIAAKMFVNSDKCTTVGSGCVSVTTQQLSDAAALAALGFPIQT